MIQYRFGHRDGSDYAWTDLELPLWNELFTNGYEKIFFREKPSFEPGYFVDNSLPAEFRKGVFDGPREVRWFDDEPDIGWERVYVAERPKR